MLRRRPGFAAAALITLALGIGAPTAIFSVVHAVLIRPLPFVQPDRVVSFRIEAQTPAGPFAFDALPVSSALEWSAQTKTLESLSVYNDRVLTLSTPEGPFRLAGISATPNLFEVLGTAPVIGRTFTRAETDRHQIVLSHAMWRRYFNNDPAIVGRALMLDGEPYRVTGVMADTFRFPTPEAAFWVPQVIDAGGSRGMVLPAIARLKPGATLAAVVGEGTTVLGDAGDPRVHETLLARTLQAQMVGGVSRVLWILMAAVSLMSVIATVNIALLLLTRGAAREREFSIRLALGAGRGRLARQLCVEGLTLATLGGLAGVVLGGVGLPLLMRLAPTDLPRLQDVEINAAVWLFAATITIVAGGVFGVLSAGKLIAFDAVRGLAGMTAESRLTPGGTGRWPLQVLAALELALTTVLLVGAGLLLRSFVALVLVPQGFEPQGAIAFQVNLPASRYPTAEARMVFLDRLQDKVGHIAGVHVAGLAAEMPNRQPTGRFAFAADPAALSGDPMTWPVVETRMVTEGFVEAMGMSLTAGRAFVSADRAGSEPVMVISERMARRQFGDRSPLGEMMYSGSGNRRVVGVVADVQPAVEGAEPQPAAYLPLRQQVDLLSWHSGMNVVVRGDVVSLSSSARSLVLSLDPNMPPSNMRALADDLSRASAGPRFSATVLGVFAALALVMAALGVYGVMAYAAGQRTREIGVRVALGATRPHVVRLMMRDGAMIVGAGLASGLLASLWLAKTLTGLLHEVTPADPVALAAVGAVLSVAGLVAASVPAFRASRVNVVAALKDE